MFVGYINFNFNEHDCFQNQFLQWVHINCDGKSSFSLIKKKKRLYHKIKTIATTCGGDMELHSCKVNVMIIVAVDTALCQ